MAQWGWGGRTGTRQRTINIESKYRLHRKRKLPIILGDILLVKNSLFLHSSDCLPFLDEKLYEICCKIPNVPFWDNNSQPVFINSHLLKKGERRAGALGSFITLTPCYYSPAVLELLLGDLDPAQRQQLVCSPSFRLFRLH